MTCSVQRSMVILHMHLSCSHGQEYKALRKKILNKISRVDEDIILSKTIIICVRLAE